MSLFRIQRGRVPFKSLLICVLLSLLLLMLPSRLAGPVRLAATAPVALVQAGLLRAADPIASFLRRFAGMWRASGEVDALRGEAARLRAQLIDESERRHAAESLLAQTGRLPAEARERALPAVVSAFDPAPQRSSAVFDRGSRSGVAINSPVLWNGAVAGRVESVGPWSCRALLLGDRGCVVAVRCARSRAQGVLEGIGGGLSRVKYVPADADVRPGDLFVTSGMDGVFPRGVLVGRCAEVSADTGESFQWVLVKPAFETALLEHVAILLPDGPIPGEK
jgi:rod shape-determining protein MreC